MLFEDFINWMQNQWGIGGVYFGVFLISFLGAVSVFIPIPYTVVIFALGATFEPLWIAVAAGIGSAVGEFSGYLIGFGGRRIINEKYKKKTEVLMKVFDKYGTIVIFLFALTPLPDDLLFIPLGVMRYSLTKAFVPALIGKFFMSLLVAYSGRFSIQIIKNIFGVEGGLISSLIGVVLAVVLLIIVFIVMFRVDWEKFLEKYVTDEGSDKKP